MKKVISLILAALLLLPLSIPSFAADVNASRSQVPVIRISGDGEPLYNADGEKIFHLRSLISGSTDSDEEKEDNSDLYASIANVLLPFLVEGLLFDKWDNYYDKLQTEISEIFDDARLDNDGNPINGTGISAERKEFLQNNMNTDKGEKGYFKHNDYWFYYDWRLDPLESADSLKAYIDGIKKTTKKDKVAIISSCIGTSVVTAYVAKYGMDDIHGIGYDGGVVGGAEMLSECIAGKFKVDANAINRLLIDSGATGLFNVDEFITVTIELVAKSGLVDMAMDGLKDTIYYKLEKGVTSALALSTFFTWPSYWSAVTKEDYNTAIEYVFGEEGSEKRTEYAGLLAKIENYNSVVRENLTDILKTIDEEGNIAVVSKYGFQILPVCESSDAVADQFASVHRSSFGATTSTIYGTLDDEYIASVAPEYISPDKQIDASTCLFPEYTWFVKGASHSNWTDHELKIIYDTITADEQLTVKDFPEYTRFMVYNLEDDSMVPMTEDNCHTENWEANDKVDNPDTKEGKLFVFIKSLIEWFISLFNLIFNK